MESLLKFIGIVVISIMTTILTGWVLTKLWLWFIVSLFNVAPLTIIQAIGLSFTASIFLGSNSVSSENKDTVTACIEAILKPLLILLFAFIFHQFQ